MTGSLDVDTSLLSGLDVGVGVKVVMVDVLWSEFSLPSVLLNIIPTVWHVVPSSFSLISEHRVSSIVVLQPSPHLLRKLPDMFIIRSLMQPVIKWAIEAISESVDVSWEFAEETWDHLVEGHRVSREVNPSRVGGEDGEGLSWPKSVALAPNSNIRNNFLHVGSKSINVEFPSKRVTLLFEVASENACPLWARNVIINVLDGLAHLKLIKWHGLGDFDVGL